MSTDHAWRALDQVNAWIRFADAKAAALLSVSGLLGGWIFATFPSHRNAGWGTWYSATLITALVAVTFAIAFALGSLKPCVGERSTGSALYFGHAARRYGGSRADFVRHCTALFAEDDRLAREICDQFGVNSAVADRKFRLVNASLAALTLGCALAGVAHLIKVV